jgi:hypothetical protein
MTQVRNPEGFPKTKANNLVPGDLFGARFRSKLRADYNSDGMSI